MDITVAGWIKVLEAVGGMRAAAPEGLLLKGTTWARGYRCPCSADHVLMVFIARRAELMRLHGQVMVRGIADWCVMMGGCGVLGPGGVTSCVEERDAPEVPDSAEVTSKCRLQVCHRVWRGSVSVTT
ncbi:hypothetical protein E2C01_040407 [Portunus trituberculatus]|uniref:Uncharacterized protein n=1 Tax=Portunus trituberculatus TaxID=210409 RepID=A0A5B7FJM3_PORTR|nr:hypothetical protein [Portunus trituberculatus]